MSLFNRLTQWRDLKTFNPSTLNTEFANIINTLNNLDAALLSWTNLKATTITPGANIAMGGFKLTGLGTGTTAGDSVRYEQWHIASNLVFTITSTKTTLTGSLADMTNITATITPTLSTSKVLVRVCLNVSIAPTSGNTQNAGVVLADGSNVALVTNNSFCGGAVGALSGVETQGTYALEYLDSPGSTSAKTYKIRAGLTTGSVTQGTGAVNEDAKGGGGNTTFSSISLQEIPA